MSLPLHGQIAVMPGSPVWGPIRGLIAAHALAFANPPAPVPTWHAPAELVRSFRTMSHAEASHLARVFEDSRQRFHPLSDPLDVRFNLHRQLSSSREEAYSDWFQWVLQQLGVYRLVARILGLPYPEGPANSTEQVRVSREVTVERGHADQTGRLDIVISQGSRRLAVIEVKTREYGESDLEKHKGYRDSTSTDSPDADLIFLAVDPPASDPGGFRFLSWADVCVALRAVTRLLLDQKHILGAALILAFVGAVEQNLLGFVSPEATPLPIGKVPRMLDHLTRAAQMESTLGRP